MNFENIYDANEMAQLQSRINNLTESTAAQWGKMSVDQMLAHCNVAFEMTYDNNHAKPNFFVGFILKTFIKNGVVGPAPYKKNSGTAPAFIIKDRRDFGAEKQRVLNYLNKTQKLGREHFENKESINFGKMSSGQWSTMFYKHLDHHLTQFGV
jgi:hypothetical protein